MKRPAIFLDRDGTLIEEVNYLSTVDDLRLFSFTEEAIRKFREMDFLIFVVTNQSGIGREVFAESAMHEIHDEIQKQLNGSIDGFYFCPHLPCDGCLCRKPNTGMIDSATRDFDIDLSNSWMIGDKRIDVGVGYNAKMRTAFVLTGYGQSHKNSLEHAPDLIADDLGVAAEEICSISAKVVV